MVTIVATAVLHILLIQQNDTILPEDLDNDQELFQKTTTLPLARQNEIGNVVRINLINNVLILKNMHHLCNKNKIIFFSKT